MVWIGIFHRKGPIRSSATRLSLPRVWDLFSTDKESRFFYALLCKGKWQAPDTYNGKALQGCGDLFRRSGTGHGSSEAGCAKGDPFQRRGTWEYCRFICMARTVLSCGDIKNKGDGNI